MWWDELNDADYAPSKRQVGPKDKDIKVYFNSMTSRLPIINAITGNTYYHLSGTSKVPYRIGSYDEGRFYVIVMGQPDNPKESCKLFFDSPEQYERFTGNEVPLENKAKFKARKASFDANAQYELNENFEVYSDDYKYGRRAWEISSRFGGR